MRSEIDRRLAVACSQRTLDEDVAEGDTHAHRIDWAGAESSAMTNAPGMMSGVCQM